MKIFVTGAAGMLAADIIPELKHGGHTVFDQPLDVTDAAAVSKTIAALGPDYVFHLAAETDVDRCEQEPEHAFKVNAQGTENVALACQAAHCKLLYMGTSGIFSDDKPGPYEESDVPHPVNVYGASKLQGEEAVARLLKEYFIIRSCWMIGSWEKDKKFVQKIIRQLRSGAKELQAVSDKFGSPTFARDFARHLMGVLETQKYGLYHMANQGQCSRYELALKITEYMGLKDKVQVTPVTSDQFPLPAKRPRSEAVRNRKLELMGLNQMPSWESSLEEYIRKGAYA